MQGLDDDANESYNGNMSSSIRFNDHENNENFDNKNQEAQFDNEEDAEAQDIIQKQKKFQSSGGKKNKLKKIEYGID